MTLKGGQRLISPLVDPRGDPSRPLDWNDLAEKFVQATRHTLQARQQQALLAALARFAQGDTKPLRQVMWETPAAAYVDD